MRIAAHSYRKRGVDMSTSSIIIIVCAAVLVCFAIWQTIQRFRGKAKNTCCGSGDRAELKRVADTDESHYPYRYRLSVSGMSCSNCAINVENRINEIEGTWTRVNLGKNEALVLSKEAKGKEDFEKALAGSGYSVTGHEVINKR